MNKRQRNKLIAKIRDALWLAMATQVPLHLLGITPWYRKKLRRKMRRARRVSNPITQREA